MQYPFSCVPRTSQAIAATLSQPRLGRYMLGAGADTHLALRMYVWNARLCEEFYLPTQLAEVSFRNTLNEGLKARYGINWHEAPGFVSTLPDRLKAELTKVLSEERKRHGETVSADHMVSGLSFGFWVHLVSVKPRQVVWRGALRGVFSHMPAGLPEADIHSKVDRLRKFRNRVAHHNAIFDKSPTAEYRNIQDIVGWICPETLWLMRELSNPARVIARRPRA